MFSVDNYDLEMSYKKGYHDSLSNIDDLNAFFEDNNL
jgi:hypothetical protein